MKAMLRHGSAVLYAASIIIFVITFIGSLGLTRQMLSSSQEFDGTSNGGVYLLISSLGNAISNSVWAFGLACVVDRLDRYWGRK